MTEAARTSQISFWTPTVLCAALSIMKMLSSDGTGDPAFYSFLPLCFYFVATAHRSLWTRIETLETERRENLAQTGGRRGT